MLAFAGNSLLCRLALRDSGIDPASFTSLRIGSGATTLWLVVQFKSGKNNDTGSWLSALALFIYAVCFSFAYVNLAAGTGALLLFGAVQLSMIGHGLWTGERLTKRQLAGLVLAFSGLVFLLAPGFILPSLRDSMLMVFAGVAWGIYSLRGRSAVNPLAATAKNFYRAAIFIIPLSLMVLPQDALESTGVWAAIVSGALASGVGYTLWFMVLPRLNAIQAATVQLSVPIIAAVGGLVFLGEPLTLKLIIAAFAILGGIAAVLIRH